MTSRFDDTHFSVQVNQVKGEQANSNFNVFNLDIFAFALAEFLEGHQLASVFVDGDSFGIQHEGLGVLFDTLRLR